MINVLKADFYKLGYNRACKLLPVYISVMTLLTAVFMIYLSGGARGGSPELAGIFGFKPEGNAGARALPVLSALYGFVGVIFAGVFISTEFVNGTIRNAVCSGISRTTVYLSKLIVTAAVLAACMFLSCAAFVIVFTAARGFGSAALAREIFTGFFMQFLYQCAFAATACMLAFLIRNIAIMNAAGMAVVIFSASFGYFCEFFNALKPAARFVPNYYITRLNGRLHDVPFLISGAALSVAVIAITATAGCALFERQDIK